MQEKWDCWQWKEYSTPQHSGWALPLSDSETNNVLQQYVFIKTRFPPCYILLRHLRRWVSIVSYSLCNHFAWIPGVFFLFFQCRLHIAQYKYVFHNWIRRGRITWLFCWKKNWSRNNTCQHRMQGFRTQKCTNSLFCSLSAVFFLPQQENADKYKWTWR